MQDVADDLESFADLFDLQRVQSCYRFLLENGSLFFSLHDQSRIFQRHVRESLEFLRALHEKGVIQGTVLDAGTGPGLPGMFFACLHRPPTTILLDSSRRKLGHLARALESRELDLPGVDIRYARIDEQKACANLITARALLPYPYVLELVLPALLSHGWLALPVGATKVVSVSHLGLSQEEWVPPAWQDGERKILLCQKVAQPRKGYPRAWKELKKDLEVQRLESP
ncbi:MAG: class I SAM-dependent methyltransferase [Spirochaetales bacterium]|nr:class I SAM-dependent methyltransferase [Spirochaetales bacterium]